MKTGKKYLLLLLCIPLLLTGCKSIPKLENGQEVVVELEGKQFSADELFEALKKSYGTSALISLVDEYIIEQNLTEEMKKEAEKDAQEQYDYYYVNSASMGGWDAFLSNYGYTDAQFKEELKKSAKQNIVLEEYLKTDVVKYEEIKEYYDKNIYGEITARHILITPDVTDDMTEEDKTKAKEAALKEAQDLIKQLNKSTKLNEDFTNLAKEKSDDSGSAKEGGLIENFTNESGLVTEFWEASLELEIDKMTQEPVETDFGYHIIYKVSQKEKPNQDTVKDHIIEKVINELLSSENANFVYWAGLREKNNLKIHDSVIKDAYDSTMNNLK